MAPSHWKNQFTEAFRQVVCTLICFGISNCHGLPSGQTAFLVFLFVCLFCPPHMEVPRLGVQLELQLLAHTTATAMPDPSHLCHLHQRSCNAGSLTHCVRPEIEPATSWFLIRFVSAAPLWELHRFNFCLVNI